MEHLILTPASSLGDSAGEVVPTKEKKVKSKKHKKHHRHDRHNPLSALPPSSGGLKIRIKVGGEEAASTSSSHKKKKKKDKKKKDKEKKHRHHHKEKRKREHANVLISVPTAPDMFESPPAKRVNLDMASVMDVQEILVTPALDIAADVEVKAPQSIEVRTAKEQVQSKPLYKLLDYILPLLEKRDAHSFFALPVSDKFAPGYSQIIKHPMDFSTIRSKLDRGEYLTLEAFKADFELMCTNAMIYNTQDTIYYKTAKKLLSIGQRLLTPHKLIPMREQLPFMKNLTAKELGFNIMDEMNEDEADDEDEDEDAKDVSRVLEDIREVVRRPPGRFEAIPDDLTSQEILEQVRKAAAGAANRLKRQKPRSGLGYLQQNNDGTINLKFLSGIDAIVPGPNRPVNLNTLVNKAKQSTVTIPDIQTDRCYEAKPVHPLHYGAFSSQGPTYDSTFANLTKEETDLVYSTYGDDVGVQYAESILNFSRNCEYAMFIVDHLLDILTGNEHRKTSKYIEEQKMLRKENQLLDGVFKGVEEKESSLEADQKNECSATPTEVDAKVDVDFSSLKSLSDEGIDMSFLDVLQTRYESLQEPTDPASCLLRTAQLLQQLKETQTCRLNQPPMQHFAHIPKPDEKELELAEKIQNNLIGMTKQLTPGDIVPVESLRKMLGIPVDQVQKDRDD